nr:PREDICTED: uncharacterized protein LOC109036195 [Bemisia tabaci]
MIERSSIQLFHACSGAIVVLILVQVTSFMVRGDDDEKWTTLQPEFRGAPKPPEFVRRLWGIYNLIPFPLVKIPEQILEIEYLDRIEVGTGRYLFARDLRSPPTRVAWPKQYVRSYYALIMTDFKSRSGPMVVENNLHNLSLHTCMVLLWISFVRALTNEAQPEIKDLNQKKTIENQTASPTFLQEDDITYKELRQTLFDNGIIPHCVDTTPNHTVQVLFPDGWTVKLGNLIPPENLTDQPPDLVKWPGDVTEFFTLIMVDLDEPSRLYPDEREWLHWMIVNIPGWTIQLGELKCRYVPPQPQEESGTHRYVFTVYKQPEKLEFTDVKLINGTNHNDLARGHFSTRMFSKEHDLGDPWAINFFQARHFIPPRQTFA